MAASTIVEINMDENIRLAIKHCNFSSVRKYHSRNKLIRSLYLYTSAGNGLSYIVQLECVSLPGNYNLCFAVADGEVDSDNCCTTLTSIPHNFSQCHTAFRFLLKEL